MGAVSGWRTILRVDSSGCGASFEKIDSSGLPDGAGDDGPVVMGPVMMGLAMMGPVTMGPAMIHHLEVQSGGEL